MTQQLLNILEDTSKKTDTTFKMLRTIDSLIKTGEMRLKGNAIEMDAGVVFKTIHGDKATITIASYPKQGSQTPGHHHQNSVEYLICISGSFSVSFGKNYRILNYGECISVGKSQVHYVTALENDSQVIAVCVPEELAYKESMSNVGDN